MSPARKLCSLSRKVYTLVGTCNREADYKAEVLLSNGERFNVYLCQSHMSKAFPLSRLEATLRKEAGRIPTVKAVSFRQLGRRAYAAAASGSRLA